MIRPPTRSPSPKLHVGNPPQLLQSNEYHALRSRFATPTQGKSQSPPASDQLDISPPLETESNAILPAATNFTSRETLQSTRRNPIVRKIGYAMSNIVSTYTGPPITGNSDIYGKFINLYNRTPGFIAKSIEVISSDDEMLNTDTPRKRKVAKISPLRRQKSPARSDSSRSRYSPTPKPRGTIGFGKSKNKRIVHTGSDSDNNSNSDLEDSDAYTPQKSIVRTRYAPWRSTARTRSSSSTNSFTLPPSSKSRMRKLGVDFGEDSSSDIEELSTDILQKSPVPTLSASRKTTTRLRSSKSQNFSRLQASGMIRKSMAESVQDTNTDSDIEVLNMSTPQKSPVQTSSILRKPTVRTSSSSSRKSSKLHPSRSDIEEELHSQRLQPHFSNTPLVNQRDKSPTLPHTPLPNDEKWWRDTFHSAEKTEQKKELDRLRTELIDTILQTRLKNVENSPQISSASQNWTIRTDSSTSRKSSTLQPGSRIQKPTVQPVEDTDADANSEGTINDCEDGDTDTDIEVLDLRIPQKSLLQTSLPSPTSTAVASSSTSQNRSTMDPSSSEIEELYTRRSRRHSTNTLL